MKKNFNLKKIILLVVALILVAFFLFDRLVPKKKKLPQRQTYESSYQTTYRPDGTVHFLSNSGTDTIKSITVEVASSTNERAHGLMYRKEMPDTVGMLFLFDQPEPQSFWMKNTYISLDIIYINSDKEIVSIQKYTQPLSELPLPSRAPAQYVVEVNGGFCDRYGINAGNKIDFQVTRSI